MNFKSVKIKDKVIHSGSIPLVCVSLMAENIDELKAKMACIVEEAKESKIDIVEFRGDYFCDLDNEDKLVEALKYVAEHIGDMILLFTIRSPREGGMDRSYDSKSIEDINRFVIDNCLADMVDVELFSAEGESKLVTLAKERGVKIIMSNHDFEKTPDKEEILQRFGRMEALGADVAKVAVMPNSEEDVRRLLVATVDANMRYGESMPIVTMSMDKIGVSSRVYGQLFGSAITFGAVGEVSAPGQLAVKDLSFLLSLVDKYSI